jgi:ABC-type lipoprotein export system ATPase subunit
MNNHFFDLIEHTNRSVFLTGKAGTGKTTFLNDFVKRTRKNTSLLLLQELQPLMQVA